MSRSRWYMVLLTILMGCLLAGCAPGDQPPAAGEPAEPTGEPSQPVEQEEPEGEPVVVRIGWPGSPDTLNPGAAVLAESYTIFELVYDSMFQLELDGSFSPDLAESFTVSEDGTVWTFTIREGLSWHDGEPLTAADIAFSYNLYKEHADFPYLNSYTAYFDSIEAPDDRTVVITLTDAIPNMESQLVFLYVVPEHIWSEYEGDAVVEFENTEMIGSGPFRMVEYAQNEFVHLAATGTHHRYNPVIDEVVFQTFDNQDTLVQALRTGQVDMVTEIPTTTVPALRNDSNIEVVSGPGLSPGVTDIIFNQVDPDYCEEIGGVCSGHPALRDRQVRLALAHATDKQQIIDIVLLGLADPGLTLIPSGLGPWYNSSLEDYAYDPALANQILDDAGYLDADGDGIRDMPDGSRPLTFRVNWPSDSITAPRMAELLAEMWAEIGVSTEQQAVDPDALTAACCPTFDYDIILWGWVSDPDPNILLSVMGTDLIESGYNESGYSNPEYDALNAEQAITLDFDERRDKVWEMQRIVHEDVVYIIPYYEQAVQAYRADRFTGWVTDQGKLVLEDISSLAVIEPVNP